jgi:hypothetical protein
MTENIKLPRKLSEERESPPARRPSHADVIENLDRWANSPELQPPKSEGKAGLSRLSLEASGHDDSAPAGTAPRPSDRRTKSARSR